jgi:integron integrase
MTPKPGLIATFNAVAVVNTPQRRALGKRTRETYLFWLRKFYNFVQTPASTWTGAEVERFLWSLHQQQYAAKSRKQALCALVYVFRHVLKVDVGTLNLPSMPREKKAIRIIPSRAEVARIFAGLHGQCRVMAGVMYGAGLRVTECCTLRVKDIDFDALTIRVHEGKGDKDRLCLLPRNLVAALQRQIAWRAALHERDLAEGAGFVDLPGRLAIKYKNAARDLRWQFLFPSTVVRGQRRWHTTPESIQGALRKAVQAAGILKTITPHTLRHAYCTHSLRAGNDAATVQQLMGHDHLETTMTYAHGDAARGVSPLDACDLVIQRDNLLTV